MAEIALPLIITAIANSELEGFVAGTLFSQGWNVIHRALDAHSLLNYLKKFSSESENMILIYSPDLSGLSPNFITDLQRVFRQVVGFASDPSEYAEYSGLLSTPNDASELLNIIRSYVRAPLLRRAELHTSNTQRAKVIALGTPSGSTGCTTVAINLGMELSLLGKETLLLDADVRHPSMAVLLSQHKLDADLEARLIAPQLSLSEFTRSRISQLSEYLDRFTEKYEYIVIDLGTIEGVSDSLTDRRWTSTLIHWSCERADELWLVGKADVLGIHRMTLLAKNFERVTIKARVSVLLNMKESGKRGDEREIHFTSAVASLKPYRNYSLPRDSRSATKAESERACLIEIGEKGQLRKSIAKIAVEVTR
ncbi:MAG: hypothetical protein Q8L08_01440 [Candidatus Nanopelagicaceae bacterium]|nr:hypothetical protein [Candidatus Nanopelagicaceae bacterium]